MAAHSLFGCLLLCYFLLLLSAATSDEEHREKCPMPIQCDPPGKCRLSLKGCEGAVQQVLLNQFWYEIDSIEPINHHQHHYSISIHYPHFQHLLSSTPINDSAFYYNPSAAPISYKILNNITFYRCFPHPNHDKAPENMSVYHNCPHYDIHYNGEHGEDKFPILPFACLVAHLPSGDQLSSNYPCTFLISFLKIGVKLTESCDPTPYFSCVNEKPPSPPPAATKEKRRDSKVVTTGLSVGLAGVTTIALVVVLLLYKLIHKNTRGVQNHPRNTNPGFYKNTTDQESGTVYFGVPVFSYEELQEATNNFDQARELGEGGFGTVYYGKLQDGREVAVKRLFERNYRPVESFINEIQILTRLRHKNLVSLFGCTSRHSRELLLVYEYIPNGTVSCHLHGDKAKPGLVPWPVRMKIAIETASALAYLHASDIIHRDVKTSNILLDNNFCVKVADFGLSRLFPTDVTHVSTAPRGTPGYVDPDYRICYQLTTKSDVYSFGVVLVELISSLPAVDMDRDEIKLANLAIRKIQKRAFCELVDPSLGFQSDDKVKKMIISVAELAFQCLQGDKELRPSMGEVLEVLQRIESGKDEPENLEGIEVQDARISHSYAHPSLPMTLVKPKHLHQTL